MKYLLIILFASNFVFGQTSDEYMLSVTYINKFKDRLSYDFPLKEYSRLLVKGNTSIYQIYNVMKLDTLLKNGTATENDIINRYFSYNKHTIKIEGSELQYLDVIFDDYYSYQEKIEYQWVIENETQEIMGYNCKKATTTYAGREWVAWFTLDIPVSAGPYKFRGLPGLIIKIADTTNSYDFELYSVVEVPFRPFEKYYIPVDLSNIIKTDRITFNKMKANYESLSLNEKINYQSSGAKLKVRKVGEADDVQLRDPKKSAKSKDLNLIEIDYK